ncbi:hypothetical protein ZIOFF_057708 [Zingiber officinale]|uniref:Uncharacterized protein n=1 Tax=Zingiber officinale TaxID=94328 RepID=A0A8J5FA00_ZINOF|nr:hypothetical protein ZIOFF_057708 [Zingiber officinale]
MDNGEIESGDEEMPSHSGQKYRPVFSHEKSSIQMTSMESGPSSEVQLKKIQIASPSETVSNVIEGTSHGHDEPNDTRRESKLELFGFDSLVNILGLKSMTGEQIPTPSSPRNGGEDISITIGLPKVYWFVFLITQCNSFCVLETRCCFPYNFPP